MILINILFGCLTIYCVYSLTCYRCETTTGTIIDTCANGPNYGEIENCDSQLRSKPQNTNLKPKNCVKVTGLETRCRDRCDRCCCQKFMLPSCITDKDGRMFTGRGCIPYDKNTCKEVVQTIGFFSDVEGGIKSLSCYPCKTNQCNASFTVESSLCTVFMISIVTSLYKL